jgi:hypothetical protein
VDVRRRTGEQRRNEAIEGRNPARAQYPERGEFRNVMIDRGPVAPGPTGHDQRGRLEGDAVGAARSDARRSACRRPLLVCVRTTINAWGGFGNGLYKPALLVLYRSRQCLGAGVEASMHHSRWAISTLVGRSRAAASGGFRAAPDLLSAELRLSCP